MSGIIAQNAGRHGGLIKAPSGGGGAWTLIQTITSDGSDASISFTSGIDSTYDEYVFVFTSIHPETDNVDFTFNGSIDGGSNYNVTKTSGGGRAAHRESDADAFLQYADGLLAESTDYERITEANGSDNDQSVSGYLHLFEPSSTTFIKLYTIQANNAVYVDMSDQRFTGGYFNTTSAIDAMDFKMSADEIQGGSISMYGIT
jgi:hypothetical protein